MKIGIKIGEGRGKKNRKMIEAEGINSLSYSLGYEWKKDGWRGRARQGFSRWEAKSLALVCA